VLESAQLQEAGEGHEVMPGCRVIELPGHSPGSIGLEVETEDGTCLLVGDAIHSAKVAQRGRNPLVFWDGAEADASIRRCVESGHLIYPGHDDPFWIRDGAIRYAMEFKMTLSNVGPETPGLSFIPNPPPAEPWHMPGIEGQRARLVGPTG
jgi:glyoxylase-like metal-dependent hydrolase (beta-lactamase superfamily II)